MNAYGQFIRFALVGVANTVIGLAAIYAFRYLGGLGDYLSNLLGYGVGLLVSYVLNSRWTFGAGVFDLARAARFFSAFAIAYGTNLGLLAFQIERLEVNPYLAQAVSVCAYTVTFFLGCRWFVYGARTATVLRSRDDA